MLKKMGWKDGEGLGRFKSGEVNPLTLDIKFDKKGLMAAEETKKGREVVTMTACKDLSGILLLLRMHRQILCVFYYQANIQSLL